MKKAIIGRKVGMTQIFDEAGKVVRRRRRTRKVTTQSSSATAKSPRRS